MIRKVLFFWGILLVITIASLHNPFFWDTVQLASKHGHFFYETGFQSVILPTEIDSGHPPLFGIYVAAVWLAFGKTLAASHLSMLPFLFGIAFFLIKIGRIWLGEKRADWLPLLCFVDPVLLGQSILVSPDVVLVCFFLMALWAIWEQKPRWLTVAVIGLGLISTRGMMVSLALCLFTVFAEGKKPSLGSALKKILHFLPGGLLAAAYIAYHYQQTGWIGYHAESAWAPSFQRVDFQGFARNIAVLGWRLLDFGRVFVWAAIALSAWFFFVKQRGKTTGWVANSPPLWQLPLLLVLLFLATVPLQLMHKGLLAHRYLLPIFLLLNLWALVLLFRINLSSRVSVLPMLVGLGLASGNLWVYPRKVSMGWDSTFAHVPWYGLQRKALAFLTKNEIPLSQVGSTFPVLGPRELYELNGVQEGFTELDLSQNCYVLYSNIMNDFTDAAIDDLFQNWLPIFEQKSGGVELVLFKNPKTGRCEN